MSDQTAYFPLFETKQGQGKLIHRIIAASISVAICVVCFYRATHVPSPSSEKGRWGWIALFFADIWFSFYWILTQALRWNCVHRSTFKDRLSARYENELPKVDIFVCTADPMLEPPLMVINTVLSVMAYDYPTEKLSIYLSDDGCSILTFHALFEASRFAKHWLPYCRKHKVEPRSPAAYFSSMLKLADHDQHYSEDFESIKKLYDGMRSRIEASTNLGRIPEQVCSLHKGFSQWDDSVTSKHDHDTILQILIDGRNPEEIDIEGYQLPTLVYLAREKRPNCFHNFKAGAMNALLRVSSEISRAPIILNVDCDMYSNNSQSIRDALCFFMDERQSQDIAYVQFPQKFENVIQDDIYGARLQVISEVEFTGLDGLGGPFYIGTGCFHRRDILQGLKYTKECKTDWKKLNLYKGEGTKHELEETAEGLADCTYELNSDWGKEVGLKYGCPVEDVITGLAIKCRGWRSVYFNPERSSFLGVAAITLEDTLVQHKRWSEGDLQIFLKHCPLWYGHNKISFALQLGYCHYCLWAVNSLATLCYCTIPSLYMIKGTSLFPEISSLWFIPFAYIIVIKYTYSLVEFMSSGGTILGWWNEQRIWLYKRTSSYLFAFIDTVLKLCGFSDMKFVITNKVADEDVLERYEKGVLEFGVPSPMFTVLTNLALINLVALVFFLFKIMLLIGDDRIMVVKRMSLQIMLSVVLILINLPLYEALFIRKDKGNMPTSVANKASIVALLACALFLR